MHAWFEFGFSASYDGNPDSGILKKFPQWAALNQLGQPVVKNGFHWMNAFLPEVQDFLTSLFLEVAENYQVAGVQGDDRFPANPVEAGYDDYTSRLFYD